MNKQTQWGFTSPDGFYQPLHLLTTQNLEYAGKSTTELEELMQQNIRAEKYEACALIRDELGKRMTASQ